MADKDLLQEITERYEYAKNAWLDIRSEGAIDMRYVGGDPWDDKDKEQRKDRPMVAPEEMGQYFNQVINQLLKNPRGMKFSPRGNGATAEGARFYQNKARETEYRSHAKVAYIAAAENAIQRSYGYLRVNTRYASPRSANQEIWIEGFPDPDMVLPDPDGTRPDSSDIKYAFVLQLTDQKEFKRSRLGKRAAVQNFGDFSASLPSWVQGTKILEAEYWTVSTRPRRLLLVQPPAPQAQPARMIAPSMVQPPRPVELFDDELAKMPPGATVIRELRMVDYPTVKMYRTNGLEILHEQDWPGKYIPLVSCYGKILYVPEGGETKRKILSMTRFGRDPWKCFCYACCQQLEILGQVPKASVLAAVGQLAGFEKDWAESMHIPKAYLLYHALTAATGQQVLPPPQRLAYLQGENLQGLEMVKEGYRRSIQAAMGSNFLPTQAQRRNEKSGVALDKIDQAAASGTWHFVDHYNDMVRRTAEIFEDLCDKVYDYQGETGVMEADEQAQTVHINDPSQKDAISTAGDYGVTVSVGPSSDSESEAAADFTETLVSNLQMVASISGPKVAAAVMARAIRMRNLGPQGDQLADLIEPPEFKQKDGQPPSPELMAAQGQIEHLTQILKRAAQEKQAKVVEQQGKFAIASMQEQAETERAGMDRETKLAVAELTARVKDFTLFLEERGRVGAQLHEASQSAHDRAQTSIENAKNRAHERLASDAAHAQALEAGDQAQRHALETGDQAAAHAADAAEQQAALQPPADGTGA